MSSLPGRARRNTSRTSIAIPVDVLPNNVVIVNMTTFDRRSDIRIDSWKSVFYNTFANTFATVMSPVF